MSEQTETKAASELALNAVSVLRGEKTGCDVARSIKGAENDYNCKGRGSTMARRVLRNGRWQWLSAPASKGRLRASDRKDATYGEAYEGEIVVQYTLGKGSAAEGIWLIRQPDSQGKVMLPVGFQRIKTGYRIALPDGQEFDISEPYWK